MNRTSLKVATFFRVECENIKIARIEYNIEVCILSFFVSVFIDIN
jgi:hypothetical protein